MMQELLVYDLLVLELMVEQPELSIREMFQKVNQLIEERGMSSDYVTPRSDKSAIEVALRRLHAARLIDRASIDANLHRLNINMLFTVIGRDWKGYPYYIPISGNGLDFVNRKER